MKSAQTIRSSHVTPDPSTIYGDNSLAENAREHWRKAMVSVTRGEARIFRGLDLENFSNQKFFRVETSNSFPKSDLFAGLTSEKPQSLTYLQGSLCIKCQC